MKEQRLIRIGFLLFAGSLVTGPFCLPARAATWGSVRANNRSAGQFHAREQQPQARARVRTAPENSNRGRSAEARPETERREGGQVARPSGVRHPEFVGPREETGRREGERRRLDFDEDHRNLYYWWDVHPGYALNTLPPGYTSIYAAGNPYYYYDGVFYEPGASGYVVVTPPLGAVVGQLPPGAE